MSPIICLTNTFPFKGEQFLKTELELADSKNPIVLWTFLPPESDCKPVINNKSIEMHIFSKRHLTFINKAKAAVSSICQFLINHETISVIKEKGKIRNLIKALKFGYTSELRVLQIKDWICCTYGNKAELTLYSYWMYEVAYVAARLKKQFTDTRFVTRCHRYDLYESCHKNGYLPYRRFVLDQADLICPISEDGKKYLHDKFNGRYDSKIKVMRLGTIRCADFISKQEKSQKIVLVSCSNLVDVKRVHLIIRSLNKCDREIVWYHFGDGVLRDELEKQAQFLPTNVKYFFMGFQENKDIQNFYANHYIDAFVNVSQSEGVPVSIMEAESYGIPVIATNVGGTSEIVHDRQNGVLLSVDFTDADLLNAIDNVITNADQYRKEALRTWENMSNANVVFPEFYKMLEEL